MFFVTPRVRVAVAVVAAVILGAGAAAGSLAKAEPSQLAAEHVIYNALDATLDFVGTLHTSSSGALTWLSVPGDDSGNISCTRLKTTFFRCIWAASLIQSYKGRATVTFHESAPSVAFSDSTCVNPGKGAPGYPNLCALDPVPGMRAV